MAFTVPPTVVINSDDDLDNSSARYQQTKVGPIAVVQLAGVQLQTSAQAFAPGPGEVARTLRRLADDLEADWRKAWPAEDEARQVDAYVDAVSAPEIDDDRAA